MELKDYLHLYLGCNVLMSDGKNILPLTGISGSLAISDFIEGAELNLIHTPIHTCRPILRPLSDIKKEEVAELLDIEGDIIRGNFLPPFFQIEYLKDGESKYEHRYIYQLNANQFKYLLDKYFDLFELIDAGLAIDSTTLKETIK